MHTVRCTSTGLLGVLTTGSLLSTVQYIDYGVATLESVRSLPVVIRIYWYKYR